MAITLSPEAEEKVFGDDAILHYLELCETAYKDGNASALFEALALCARFQAVIPEWAADAILVGEEAILRGDCKDFNALFGQPSTNARERKRKAMISDNTGLISGQLMDYRCKGGTFNAEDAFDYVAQNTGLPRRIIEEVYRRNPALKDIPQGNPEGANYAIGNFKPPMPRRRGRKII